MSADRPFWTIGRDREKAYTAEFVKEADQQALIFAVIDAALDCNEASGSGAEFVEKARVAMVDGNSAVWQNASSWVRKVGERHPASLTLWDQLASHASWQVRWRVACLLYNDIPDAKSDDLFALLRHDKSAKVREYAVSRYENRPGPDRNIVFKMFDADAPSSPGLRRGN
ncbi:MAG: hypothetical protein V4574_03905 [Pseudomonadota bacterium]